MQRLTFWDMLMMKRHKLLREQTYGNLLGKVHDVKDDDIAKKEKLLNEGKNDSIEFSLSTFYHKHNRCLLEK